MELIRKISQALRHLQEKKLSENRTEELFADLEEKHIALAGYLDRYEKDHELIDHQILKRIAETSRQSPEKLYDTFAEISRCDSWHLQTSLADIPVKYDCTVLDEKMLIFSQSETIAEQTDAIAQSFSELNPTNLELLAMLLDGDAQRFQQPASEKMKLLIERENVARSQLEKLLNKPWSDHIRWWLVKSVNNLSPAARNFIQQTARERKDMRLNAMILIMLLKTGLEWASVYPSDVNKTVAEFFFAQTYNDRIINLTKLLPG